MAIVEGSGTGVTEVGSVNWAESSAPSVIVSIWPILKDDAPRAVETGVLFAGVKVRATASK